MRKVSALFLAAVMLAACGPNHTPLTHALAAFRAGDHDDFLSAKAEAEEAVKHAIQPSDDLCMMTMMDIERYGAVTAIEKMDRPELWRLNEEGRLIYALKIAGTHLKVDPDGFLSHAPLYTSVSGQGNSTTCVGERDKMMATMAAAGPESRDADEARMDFMQGWMRDVKARDGDKFDDQMRSASVAVDNAGYNAPWPAEIDFIE